MSVFMGNLPRGWSGGEAVTKWWKGSWIHLYRLRKSCAQCGAEMVIDVTKAALEGRARNAGLHLARCETCRSQKEDATSRPAVLPAQSPQNSEWGPVPTEERTIMIAGRPVTQTVSTVAPAALPDLSKVLMGNDGWTVEDEITQLRGDVARTQRNLDAARAELTQARTEIARLKVESTICPQCLTFNEMARQSAAPKNNSKKLPWEG
jgi:hypothetical protein